MRKLFFALPVLILVCILLNGCDAGLEIVGLEINKYPDKIVYVAGTDTKLDLSGGKIEYILLDKRADRYIEPMDNGMVTVTHNIDFNKPGVYVVTLTQHKGKCQFPVQVISKDFLSEVQNSVR